MEEEEGSTNSPQKKQPFTDLSILLGSSMPLLCVAVLMLATWLGFLTLPYVGRFSELYVERIVVSEVATVHLPINETGENELFQTDAVLLPPSPLPSPPQNDVQNDQRLHVQEYANTSMPVLKATCDLYDGKWIQDPLGPLYRNDSCPILSQAQNCQGNGRPDKGYENWRWAPNACNLLRFDANVFFKLMSGKVLAFVGDSVCRNHMESLMCTLMQVETPVNKGFKKMQRWYFRSHSVTIIRIWSSWLVHTNVSADGLTHLYLDQVDEKFAESLPMFDVLVISSGHWFTKRAAFVVGNEVVGGQLWWHNNYPMKYNNADALSAAMHTALEALVSLPSYKGLTIFRTYSPDHYEGGAWNTGGSCTGKTKPDSETELVHNGFTESMHGRQIDAFNEAAKHIANLSKLRIMDVTSVFQYRGDGHPGPFRNQDPNKKTKRDLNGRPPPQDCLHWCMPGPVDVWNDFLLEILRQEFS